MYALIAFFLLLFVTTAEAQVSCAQYGKHFYCIGPNGNTTQTDLGNGMGVISGDHGLTPYAVLPPSRSSGFDPRGGLQPLPALPGLPTLPSLPTLNYGSPVMPSLAPPPAPTMDYSPLFLTP